MTERLLREYVREVLREDDTGAVWADLHSHDMGMHPYGAQFGSGNDLFKIFVKPFVDVFDTTMGKTKELSVKAQTLARVAFETIATTLVPIFSDSYKEIFANEKKHIDKIRQEYKEVYQSNWDAFRDNDAFWTAFCYAPWAIITIKLIKHSPKTAGRMLSTLTGGKADKVLSRLLGDWQYNDGPPRTGLDVGGRSVGGGRGMGGSMGGWRDGHGKVHGGWGETSGMGFGGMSFEGVVREDSEGGKRKAKAGKEDDAARLDKVAKLLTSDQFMGQVRQSEVVQGMEQEAKAAVRGALSQVYKEAKAVMGAKSLQDLQARSGKQLKGLDKLQQVPQAERQKVEAQLLATLRQAMKNFYVKSLEQQVEAALKGGVPEDSPYVRDYRSVIAKVKAL